MRATATCVLLLWTMLAACDGEPAGGARPRYFGSTRPRHGPHEVWSSLIGEPESIDPGKCADQPGGVLIMNLFAGLTQPHPSTLEPMPDVAESWDVSADGRSYTFHLRRTNWSDGVPLTAYDFEYAWIRLLARETASRYASFLFPLKNAERFNQGKAERSEVGVRALDDQTLKVELEEPLPYFLALTNYHTLMPVPKHVIDRLARQGMNTDLWTRPEHIVSNGAFVLSAWKFRQFVILKKNPRYWDSGSVALERVRLTMVESNNTALNLYEAGELDCVGSSNALPAEFMDHLKTFDDFRNHLQLSVYFYWFNVKAKPLDDARVRRALSMAVDRAALVQYVARAGQIASADLVPDGLAGYRGAHRQLFDPAGARRLLAEAGYGPGHPLPPIVMRYNTAEQHKQIAEAVQQMWKRELGVDVQIENQEWKVYLKTLYAMDFQIARLGWIGDYPDPYTFLELLTTGNGNNHSNWGDATYDATLRRANATSDRQARLTLLQAAERIALDAAPVLPVYVYTRPELIKPYVMGYFTNPQARSLMKYWWVDERWSHGVPATRLQERPLSTPSAVAP